jgi:hypothetical protein
MKTEIKILVKNTEKRVHQNLHTGDLYIKDGGELLKCEWVNEDYMRVAFYGNALVLERIAKNEEKLKQLKGE